MESSCGRSSSSGTRACSTRPTGCMPYSLGRRDAAVELRDPPRRRHPAPPGPGRSRSRSTLEPVDGDPGPLRLLVWTTTPWTLPSNLALAVGPDIDYARRRARRHRTTSSAPPPSPSTRPSSATAHGADDVQGRATSSGARYRRRCSPTSPTTRTPSGSSAGDFVDTDEGTGVVHIAPGFGEDDQRVCEAAGIRRWSCPSTTPAASPTRSPTGPGENVFDANPDIIRAPQGARRRRPPRHATTHNYPHCWRTDTPIIYRAVTSWYVRVTDAHGPHARAQPADQLDPRARPRRPVRQVARGRPRLVDQPQPLLGLTDPGVAAATTPPTRGSTSTAASTRSSATSACAPTDLHRPTSTSWSGPTPTTRPAVDDAPGPRGARLLVRVGLDALRPGPLPVREPGVVRARTSPADFIVEYIAQTRGWFYTLHVLATALFDRPAVPERASATGSCSTSDGRKLSKRLRNYPDPEEVFETHRLRRPALVPHVVADPAGPRPARSTARARASPRWCASSCNPIWNAFHFFTLYANVDGYRAAFRTDATDVLDRYVLAKTRELVEAVTDRAWTPTTSPAPAPRSSPSSTPSTTGTSAAAGTGSGRRARRRTSDGASATPTTRSTRCCVTLARVVAPLLPLLAEEIHTALTGERARAPRRLARRRPSCPPTPSWCARWTGSATSPARPPSLREEHGSAHPPAAAVADRRRPRHRRARRPAAAPRRRGQRQGGRADRRPGRLRRPSAATQRQGARAQARRGHPGGHAGPRRPGTGSTATTAR